MEVELHQLEMRYERLRKRHPRAERTLLASLAEIGQQVPVVVVGDAERFVLIDGYKRARALRRLARDIVVATRWELEEVEALLLERGLRRGSEDALDQAWLLAELEERFGYTLEELARRFEHSKSWGATRVAQKRMLLGWREATMMMVRKPTRREAELTGCSVTHSLWAVAESVRSRLKRPDNAPPRERRNRSVRIGSGVCQLHGGRGARLGGRVNSGELL